MDEGVTFAPKGDIGWNAFWQLHTRVVLALGYRVPLDPDVLSQVFHRRETNVPSIYIGQIEQPNSQDDLYMWQRPNTSTTREG